MWWKSKRSEYEKGEERWVTSGTSYGEIVHHSWRNSGTKMVAQWNI